MTGVYMDTSVIGRTLLDEPDTQAIQRALGEFEQRVSSRLLRVELRRLALREGLLDLADELLTSISLLPIDDALLQAAESVLPTSLATFDAIHLVTAIRAAGIGGVDAVMTYDARLAAGAREHGLEVIAPS